MTYRSWLALFLTASLSATAFAGCASDEAKPADDTAATTDDSEDELKALIITDKDNKKTFNVKYGQTVTVKLTSNASTGYEWKILATDKSFGYPSSTVVSPGTAVGGSGYTKLVWKTNNPFAVGQHTVTLGYQRADATADAKIKTFTFTVIVADKSTDAGAAEGKSCGGYANTPCAAGLRCEFGTTPAGAAGSLTGVCKKPPVSECVVGGCSGQLCVEDSAGGGISTCEWKDEYACYKAATCERQKDGACGWTASTALDACLAGGGTGAPGAFCGGIGNIQCPAGQTCQIEATHPDAGGTCILAGETLGKPCGAIRSIGFVACNAGEFCSYTLANICGRADATGTCAVQPTSCPVGCPAPANQPCGCDGQKYCNECEANKAGVSIVACE